MIHTQPDYPGRSSDALAEIFNALIADIRGQWVQPKPESPDLPEPMLGAMGVIAKATNPEN